MNPSKSIPSRGSNNPKPQPKDKLGPEPVASKQAKKAQPSNPKIATKAPSDIIKQTPTTVAAALEQTSSSSTSSTQAYAIAKVPLPIFPEPEAKKDSVEQLIEPTPAIYDRLSVTHGIDVSNQKTELLDPIPERPNSPTILVNPTPVEPPVTPNDNVNKISLDPVSLEETSAVPQQKIPTQPIEPFTAPISAQAISTSTIPPKTNIEPKQTSISTTTNNSIHKVLRVDTSLIKQSNIPDFNLSKISSIPEVSIAPVPIVTSFTIQSTPRGVIITGLKTLTYHELLDICLQHPKIYVLDLRNCTELRASSIIEALKNTTVDGLRIGAHSYNKRLLTEVIKASMAFGAHAAYDQLCSIQDSSPCTHLASFIPGYILTGHADGSIYIRYSIDGTTRSTLKLTNNADHSYNAITSIYFTRSADCKYPDVLAANKGGTIYIWKYSAFEKIYLSYCSRTTVPIQDNLFLKSTSGLLIYIGTDNSFHVWNGQPQFSSAKLGALSNSNDGKGYRAVSLIEYTKNYVLTCTSTGILKLWYTDVNEQCVGSIFITKANTSVDALIQVSDTLLIAGYTDGSLQPIRIKDAHSMNVLPLTPGIAPLTLERNQFLKMGKDLLVSIATHELVIHQISTTNDTEEPLIFRGSLWRSSHSIIALVEIASRGLLMADAKGNIYIWSKKQLSKIQTNNGSPKRLDPDWTYDFKQPIHSVSVGKEGFVYVTFKNSLRTHVIFMNGLIGVHNS